MRNIAPTMLQQCVEHCAILNAFPTDLPSLTASRLEWISIALRSTIYLPADSLMRRPPLTAGVRFRESYPSRPLDWRRSKVRRVGLSNDVAACVGVRAPLKSAACVATSRLPRTPASAAVWPTVREIITPAAKLIISTLRIIYYSISQT